MSPLRNTTLLLFCASFQVMAYAQGSDWIDVPLSENAWWEQGNAILMHNQAVRRTGPSAVPGSRAREGFRRFRL